MGTMYKGVEYIIYNPRLDELYVKTFYSTQFLNFIIRELELIIVGEL